MPRHTDSRAKALATAEQLFRSQGYAATGLAQIIADSGSPKGSFYFHFPGGKAQLAGEALAAYVDRVDALLRHLAARHPGDAAGFVQAVLAAVIAEMDRSAFQISCLVQILANEYPRADAALTARLAAATTGWAGLIAAHLASCGQSAAAADAAAAAMVMLLQGARVIARIEGSRQPLDAAARLVLGTLETPP